MVDLADVKVGVVFWQKDAELNTLASTTCQSLRCKVVDFFFHEKLPPGLDLVLAFGPFGSLVPIVNQLLASPVAQRPKFALWMTEQFPHPSIPGWVLKPIGALRSGGERYAHRKTPDGLWKLDPRFGMVTSRGHRLRYYGDLNWLLSRGILSVIAVGSSWIAEYLRQKGFNPLVAYIGSHPEWGELLNTERTIPVIWLGKLGTDRRRHVLQQVRGDLQKRGIEVLMIDGVEHPYVFGNERTILLNKTKIAINFLREAWDNHSLRYFISAQNGVLVVTEPTLPHTPFIPGEHIVSREIGNMAEAISYYLDHEQERKTITNRAYRLVMEEITMKNSVLSIIQSAMGVPQNPS